MENEDKNLSERLRFTLKILGISQTELANRIDVKPQIVQYLCQGKAEKSKFTFDIAEALNVDVSWLATGKGVAPCISQLRKNTKTIPILTFNQIREGKIYKRKFDPMRVTSWIPIKEGISQDSFAIVLNDKSMMPRFDLDTIVIIDPTVDAYQTQQKNKFVLAYLAEEDFLVFRQLHINDNVKSLIAHNNNLYKNVLLKDEDIILGICTEARWTN